MFDLSATDIVTWPVIWFPVSVTITVPVPDPPVFENTDIVFDPMFIEVAALLSATTLSQKTDSMFVISVLSSPTIFPFAVMSPDTVKGPSIFTTLDAFKSIVGAVAE